MGVNEMPMQTLTNDLVEGAGRLRLPGRYERKDDPLRPVLPREREIDLVMEMAHDLRSPLTSVISLAELLQTGQSGPVNATQRRQLGLIYSAALCLCATASDMIELARAGDRLAEVAPVRFALSEIMLNVRDMVRPMVEVRGLELQIESGEPDARLGFPRALSRVLLNLTTNAVKNTDHGSVMVTARALTASQVEFSVRDTGRGIAPEDMAHLFEPFHSGSSQDRHPFSGAGLGLAISRKLVQAMGSDLKVDTAADWGTRFYFEIEFSEAL
jgi:hypothetical protein